MKKTLFFAVALAFLIINAKPILAVETEYNFKISTYMVENGRKTEWGLCSFTLPENKYGRASFTFFKGLGGFEITFRGDSQVPVTRLLSESGAPVSAGQIFLAADLYLKASSAEGGLIRLKGILMKLTQAESKGAPLFEYSEEELDFILPNNGTKSIPIGDDQGGKRIYLDLSVRAEGELVYKQRITRSVSFDTEYYLYNLDTEKYELEGRGCVLGLGLDTQVGKATCFKQKVYKIHRGDSLLYIAAYEIKNPTLSGPNEIKFQLEVSHIYAVNPIMDGSRPEELKSDKTTVVLFNKEITAKIGEKTEIEIPQDKGSLLPFNSKETIVLVNSVKDIKEQ